MGICIAFIVFFVAIPILAHLHGEAPLVPGLAIFLGVFIVVPFLVLLILLRRLNWRVLLLENGFIISRNGLAESVLWSDIQYLREKVVIQYGHETGHDLQIQLESGRKICLVLCHV